MKRVLFIAALLIPLWVHAEELSVKDYYLQATELRKKGNFTAAIEHISTGIALNQPDKKWMAKSELLCVALYIDLKLFDAAEVTARQVEKLYAGTEYEKVATILRKRAATQAKAIETEK